MIAVSLRPANAGFQSTLPTRGSDPRRGQGEGSPHQFQSTLPTRGSDSRHKFVRRRCSISIHAPHEGERPLIYFIRLMRWFDFNPRSPRGGATREKLRDNQKNRYFNPRSPRGGATIKAFIHSLIGDDISIHAPHEGERRRLLII